MLHGGQHTGLEKKLWQDLMEHRVAADAREQRFDCHKWRCGKYTAVEVLQALPAHMLPRSSKECRRHKTKLAASKHSRILRLHQRGGVKFQTLVQLT